MWSIIVRIEIIEDCKGLKSEVVKMGDYKTVLDPDILLEFDHLGLTRFYNLKDKWILLSSYFIV